MDINLERTLRQRQESGQCIICTKELNEKMPQIILKHFILGNVLICESHIKSSEGI